MSAWQTKTIADLGKVVTGSTPASRNPGWFGDSTPFVTPSDMTERDRRPRPERWLSIEGRTGLKTRLVPEGSVAFVCIGATIGKVCLLPFESVTNQQINTVIPREETDGRFLYYLLRHVAPSVAQAAGGAATPIINKSAFSSLHVKVPDFVTQSRIGDVLGSVDDVIENNRRRVEVLEEMARSIYREWFVKFRYPGHEDVPLVGSSLDPIPEGWTAGRLGMLVDEIRESVQPGELTRSLPYVPIDEIDARSLTLNHHRPGEDAASSLRLFREGDIIFGAMRAYFHKVCLAAFDGVTRSTCFVLRPQPRWGVLPLLYLDDDATVAFASNHSSGSTIPYAKWEGVLSERKVPLPPVRLAERFTVGVEPMLDLARELSRQANELVALRDLLLPRLVTGQIDVSMLDLDALVEERVAS